MRGNTEELVCTAQGGPGNTFTWTQQDDSSVVSTEAAINVTVGNASVGGIYQCTVMNNAGNDTTQTTLNGRTLPDKCFNYT